MAVPFVIGAVAYDPKVVTIWDGFRALFRERGLDTDVVLFTNYERQVEALLAGHIDTAWNSPLAWVRARRLAEAAGRTAQALVMRDTDQDLTSLILVRSSDVLTSLPQLRGATIATGAIDSRQGDPRRPEAQRGRRGVWGAGGGGGSIRRRRPCCPSDTCGRPGWLPARMCRCVASIC